MTAHAIAITKPQFAEWVEIPDPGELQVDQVRGKTLCTLISPGTELAYNYNGNNFPTFPGYAAVFIAEEIGKEVKQFGKGQICFAMGTHRSLQQHKADNVCPVPKDLPPEQAVLARLMGVSMTTLITTSARPGDRVLVTGAGPVGFLAAQMFAWSGYEVLVSEPDETRRQQVRDSGIENVYPQIPVEDPKIAGTIALVVECSGHEQAVLDACKIVRKRGEVVLVGVPWQRQTDHSAHDILSLVFHKYVLLRSGWEWELPRHSADFQPHSISGNFATALRWLSEGRIHTRDLIASSNPRKAQSLYQDLQHRRAKGLFQIFDWTSAAGAPT